MNNQHPIFPPPELRNQWHSESLFKSMGSSVEREDYMINCAAQWGADQELEACCEWLQEEYKTESWVTHDLKRFRTARRPKPLSLKKQALEDLNELLAIAKRAGVFNPPDNILRALEALPND